MHITRKIAGSMLVVLVLLAGAVSVFSQEKQPSENTLVVQRERTPQEPEAVQPMSQARRTVQPMRQTPDDNFYYVASEMSFDGKLVKGAPYSGQGVTEVTQVLADGNRIVKRSTTMIYRDSEGRTRKESTLRTFSPATGGEPPTTIFISDPVAGTTYMLDTNSHVARKMPPYRFEWKTPGEGVRTPATPATPPGEGIRVPAPGAPPTPGATGEGGNRTGFMVRTPEPQGGDHGVVMQFQRDEGRKPKPESLGKQTVEGVEAEGSRMTVTIPAGEIGNERAIDIVSDRWYSPELQTVVMTRHSDPRFGETVYRLTNINRGEQPRTLFEVPGDYTVKSGSTGIGTGTGGGVGSSSGTMVVSGANSDPKAIQGGVLNGKAIHLAQPAYPPIARAAKASGQVVVQITIDEDGNVISASVDSGHPLLRAAAVAAARESKFSPTRLSGQPVKVQGVVIYNFAANE